MRRLEYAGVRVVTLLEGYDSQHSFREEQRWLTGFINRAQLRQLAAATHRGLSGQVERGYHAGGQAYGYRSIAESAGHRLEIDESSAPWVRWIFNHYAAGWSTQKIAYRLNELAVLAPRGKTWAVSAIYGSPAKGCGILNNELYIGRYIWNRSAWTKDPDTGTRKRLERPREEWQIDERPELRIVPQALWEQVRTRIDTPTQQAGSRGKGRAPTSLLGGILRCGACNGAMIVVNGQRYGCAARKDRGPAVCPGIYVRRDIADERIIGTLRDRLLAPESLAELHRQARALAAERLQPFNGAERLIALGREIKNLVDAIAMLGISPELAGRLREKQAEQARLREAQAAPATMLEVDNLVEEYRNRVADLTGSLGRDPVKARAALGRILEEVRICREAEGTFGYLRTTLQRLALAAGAYPGMVAGAGFYTRIQL
jgi:hypothetical protein